MDKKYEYAKGFCTYQGLKGLYPVLYELEGARYHRKQMACTFPKTDCFKNCDVLFNVPEVFPECDEWRLKDKL